MSSELQRFNDVVKEDGEIRSGIGGKLAAKHNLPLKLNMSFTTGGDSKVSFQIVIPESEIAPLSDELKEIFGETDTRFSDLSHVTKISFELDAHGDIVPKSLTLDSPTLNKQTEQLATRQNYYIPRNLDSPTQNKQTEQPIATGEHALCENCHINQGPQFAFTYGKQSGQNSFSTQSGAVQQTTTTTSYEIGGQMSVPICDSCRQDYFRQSLVKGTGGALVWSLPLLIFIYLIMTTGGQAEGFTQFLMFITVPIFSGPLALVGLAPFFNVLEDGSQRAGENLAIDLTQYKLRQQGFDKFWNSRRYDQLKRFGK